MSYVFAGATFDGAISAWNISRVTNLEYAFLDSSFSGDVSGWDTSGKCSHPKYDAIPLWPGTLILSLPGFLPWYQLLKIWRGCE